MNPVRPLRAATTGSLRRAALWVAWSPRRVKTTALTAAVASSMAVAVWGTGVAVSVLGPQVERATATRAAGEATRQAPPSGLWDPLWKGDRLGGGEGIAVSPPVAPTATATTPAEPTDPPPSAADRRAAVTARAEAFTAAWVAGGPDWPAGMTGHATSELMTRLAGVDRAAVPDAGVERVEILTSSETQAAAGVALTDGGTLTLVLAAAGDGWVVQQFEHTPAP